MIINESDILKAITRACKGRWFRRDVVQFTSGGLTELARRLQREIADGSYLNNLGYAEKDITNVNGKARHLLIPTIYTLTMQHLSLVVLEPVYKAKDPNVGLNCKKGCGVSAKRKERSVIKRMKHVYFDRRDLHYIVTLDQRKCYDHVSRKLYRRGLKRLGIYSELNDFCVNVAFRDDTLPVGTPTSPMAHHVIMLGFDRLIREMSGVSVRYADNVALFFPTKEEANRAAWRVRNYWWYEMGIRAKKHEISVRPLTLPTDFCGNVFVRNAEVKRVADHNKGHVLLRQAIADRARRATEKSYPSYFGLLKSVDGFNLMLRIENTMKLRKLTEKIRINRSLDAQNIPVKELAEQGIIFDVHDYEIRKDKNGIPNWIKCLISIADPDDPNPNSGRCVMREFHGGYQYIVDFHEALERAYPNREFLPIEECRIQQSCGYIYEDSTNMLHYLEDMGVLN